MSIIHHAESARTTQRNPALTQSLAASPATGVCLEECLSQAQRMVILVPCGELDEEGLARRIWSLAVSTHINKVLYLTLVSDADLTYAAGRRLVNLCAITRDPRFDLRSVLIPGKHWAQAISGLIEPEDVLLIHAEQFERKGLRGTQDMKTALGTLGPPIYSLEGFYQESQPAITERIQSAARWFVPLAVILLFLFLQISVDQLEHGWIEITFQILLLMLEVSLIWFANGLLG